MSPRIFVTGVSGYIGGNTVGTLVEKHPDFHIVALVRNEEQARMIQNVWPKVSTVIGNLDDRDILVEEGKKADVVLQMASADHVLAGESIIEGMGQGKKGHYVHTSGTGMLHETPNGYGNPSEKRYSDVESLEEILSFDASHIHRDVDASVIAAGEQHGVPTAILSPPTIFGVGKGPLKKRSLQIPFLIDVILNRGKAFTVGAGNNIWDNVHIQDLSNAYVVLVEEALRSSGGAAAWGRSGYYFVTAAEHTWAQVTRAIAKIAHERYAISTAEVEQLDVEEATKVHPWAGLLWGGNCRSQSDRLHALGWKASGPTIFDSLAQMVDAEIQSNGARSSTTTF